MKSNVLKQGLERAPHRALLRAVGVTDQEMNRPFIGVINSFNEIIPGHMYLRQIGQEVKAGVRSAGSPPFECSTVSVCDGLAMNHPGMKYSLPSRELIADSVEIVAQLPPWRPKVNVGFLKRYAEVVTSASTGAVFR